METLTVAEIATRLKMARTTILANIKAGRLQATRHSGKGGRFFLVTLEDFKAFVPLRGSYSTRPDSVNPSGLCMCGCGEPTNIVNFTQRKIGVIKGDYARYVPGHNALNRTPPFIINPATNCWEWQRHRDKKGYGRIGRTSARIRSVLAHRIYYEAKHGPLPANSVIDHLCKNRCCVNPDHLEPVSWAVNAQRRVTNYLDPEKVKRLRSLYANGTPISEIAASFGVRVHTALAAATGKTWKNV